MQPNQILYYVKDIPSTLKLYTDLLDAKPMDEHPTYASIKLANGFVLSFWQKDEVAPACAESNAGSELLFYLESKEAVDECFAKWQNKITMIQAPTTLCFGYAFTAIDADNNRLRVLFESH